MKLLICKNFKNLEEFLANENLDYSNEYLLSIRVPPWLQKLHYIYIYIYINATIYKYSISYQTIWRYYNTLYNKTIN